MVSDNIVPGPLWGAISLATAILCGNLPVIKPLFNPTSPWVRSLYTHIVRKENRKVERRIDDDEPLTRVGSLGKDRGKQVELDMYPMDSFYTTMASRSDEQVEEPVMDQIP